MHHRKLVQGGTYGNTKLISWILYLPPQILMKVNLNQPTTPLRSRIPSFKATNDLSYFVRYTHIFHRIPSASPVRPCDRWSLDPAHRNKCASGVSMKQSPACNIPFTVTHRRVNVTREASNDYRAFCDNGFQFKFLSCRGKCIGSRSSYILI